MIDKKEEYEYIEDDEYEKMSMILSKYGKYLHEDDFGILHQEDFRKIAKYIEPK